MILWAVPPGFRVEAAHIRIEAGRSSPTILVISIAAQGIAGAVLILAGHIYAWNGDSRSEEPSTTERRAMTDGSIQFIGQLLMKIRSKTPNRPNADEDRE
ncbi:hypothetical protein [Methanorbis rubei]|uniref:hypothetical protein n=1 Tax=Methanorbis rubei TaxID=3028300 RepID=UPI0030B9035B